VTRAVPAWVLRVWLVALTVGLVIVSVIGTVGPPGPVDPWIAVPAAGAVLLLAAGTAARPHSWLPGAALVTALILRLAVGPGLTVDPVGAVLLAILAVAVHSCAAWCAVLPAGGAVEAGGLVAPVARVSATAASVVAVALIGAVLQLRGGTGIGGTGTAAAALATLAVLAGLSAVATTVAVTRRAPGRS
jgi:hypothetical protein